MFVDCTDWVDWRAWKFSSDQETDYVPDRPDGMAFQATATMRGRQWEDPQLWQQTEIVPEAQCWRLTSTKGLPVIGELRLYVTSRSMLEVTVTGQV